MGYTTFVSVETSEHQTIRDAAAGDVLLRAESLGVSASAMARMEVEGSIERLAPGIYLGALAPRRALSEAAAWSLRYPTVVAGLVTAAVHHDLTDAFSGGTWLLAAKGSSFPRSRSFPLEVVQVAPWLVDPTLDEVNGVDTVAVHGAVLRITGPDRTVLDMWRYPRRIPSEHALQALRSRVAAPGFELPTFSRLARRLGAWSHIEQVLQGLLLR